MVTTHHPELKVYSVETPGVRNASVEFDLNTLAPTYRLIMGLPGRSNALAIAQRIGLDAEIIEDARSMVATEDLVADDLLDEIHRTREDIRRQQQTITEMREELETQRAELQANLSSVEDERRDVISATRRNMQNEIDDFRRELKRLRNEMRDASLPLEKLRSIQDVTDNVEKIVQQPIANGVKAPEGLDWTPRLGDSVWLEPLKAEGTIIELDKDDAMVQIGTLKVRTALRDLKKPTRVERKILSTKGRSRRVPAYDATPTTPMPKTESPGLELDLRGARVEDALEQLDDYIDAAYMSGIPFGRIIHGKGTGALRRAVQDRVAQHPLISKAMPAPPKEGGDGVTIIHLAPTV
jgi:DNA mismatch repair protein MutS2